jgi:Rho GTPase-activating protein 1
MHLEKSHAFGVSLEELMGDYGESSGIPRVIKDAVAYIRSSGM